MYYNDRSDVITIVERRAGRAQRSTLEPRVRLIAKEGEEFPQRVEILDSKDRQIGMITRDAYDASRSADVPTIVVASGSAASLASRSVFNKLAQEWEGGARSSKPLTFAGGDGSSPDQAIIVRGHSSRDESLGPEEYLRKRFGYLWTYRHSQLSLEAKNGRIYDRYELVTFAGKKHVVYFDTTKFRAAD